MSSDDPTGGFDLPGLLAQAASMQQQLLEAQEELAQREVQGSAGGGLVSATVSGTGELIGLVISPEVCDPEDTETLADLLLAAVRAAADNAQQLVEEQMGDLTSGFGGGLLGLGSEGPAEGSDPAGSSL